MAPDNSRPKRTTAGRKLRKTIDDLVNDLFRDIENAQTIPPGKPSRPSTFSGELPHSEREIEPTDDIPAPRRRNSRKCIVNLDEIECVIQSTTYSEDKRVWQDMPSCRLNEGFEARNYYAKSIVLIQKEADKLGTGFEFASGLATLSGTRMEPLAKTIKEPDNWEGVAHTIGKEG
jgi:hypothetical protein